MDAAAAARATPVPIRAPDHSDLLEDDDDDEDDLPPSGSAEGSAAPAAASASRDAQAGGLDEDGAPVGGDPLAGLEGGLDGGNLDPDQFREALGGVTAGLAEQLTSITSEMNKIRSELYGDNGIGGIAKELQKLKDGGLGGLLGDDALAGLGEELGGGGTGSSQGPAGRPADLLSDPALEACRRRGAPDATHRQGKADLDALRRKLEEQRSRGRPTDTQGAVSFGEKMMLLCLVMVCLFVASPFFRASVKRALGILIWGEADSPADADGAFGWED